MPLIGSKPKLHLPKGKAQAQVSTDDPAATAELLELLALKGTFYQHSHSTLLPTCLQTNLISALHRLSLLILPDIGTRLIFATRRIFATARISHFDSPNSL